MYRGAAVVVFSNICLRWQNIAKESATSLRKSGSTTPDKFYAEKDTNSSSTQTPVFLNRVTHALRRISYVPPKSERESKEERFVGVTTRLEIHTISSLLLHGNASEERQRLR